MIRFKWRGLLGLVLVSVAGFSGTEAQAREFYKKRIQASLTRSDFNGHTERLGSTRGVIRFSDDRELCEITVGEFKANCDFGEMVTGETAFIVLDSATIDHLLTASAGDHFGKNEKPAVSSMSLRDYKKSSATRQAHTNDKSESYHLKLRGSASHSY